MSPFFTFFRQGSPSITSSCCNKANFRTELRSTEYSSGAHTHAASREWLPTKPFHIPHHCILYSVLYIPYAKLPDLIHCTVHSQFHTASFCTFPIPYGLILYIVHSLFHTSSFCKLCCTFPIQHALILYTALVHSLFHTSSF